MKERDALHQRRCDNFRTLPVGLAASCPMTSVYYAILHTDRMTSGGATTELPEAGVCLCVHVALPMRVPVTIMPHVLLHATECRNSRS